MDTRKDVTENSSKRFSNSQVFAIGLGIFFVTVAITLLALRFFFFPAPFAPVELSEREKLQLAGKLDKIEQASGLSLEDMFGAVKDEELTADGLLKPEPYSEEEGSREIYLSERELNALLANNTELAQKAAIDLSRDLISAKLLVPVDPDFPILGGKTIRVRAGLEFAFREGRPVVKLKGISLMGVPLPNAWLGGIKNVDLAEEYGFWRGFSGGIDTLAIREGKVFVRLKE
ncbi:arginine N-succinyltransferase [Prosthecochloris sp.]|uniref:arginine N-succinyltransferase n=1 Tax=Prosthecochloris sp. TaxID=290513 RepID=UPI0025DDAD94|nr:arginine N-succinyltransferase [Prosthecochloris sp.]